MRPIAAIDMGSNTMFLKIINPQTEAVLLDQVVFAQISQGATQNGFISAEKVIKATETIHCFKKLIEQHNVIAVKGAATAVYRDTTNGQNLIDYLKDRFQLDLSVVSGLKEAELARTGVAGDLSASSYKLLDIGGRSTEITAIKDHNVIFSHSFPFGTVSITEQFLSETPSPKELENATNFMLNHLKQKNIPNISPLVGLGGSPTTLGAAALKLTEFDETKVNGTELSLKTVSKQLQHYTTLTLKERQHEPGLDPRRADLIVAGALILEQVIKYLNTETLTLSTRGIRDGLLIELMESL